MFGVWGAQKGTASRIFGTPSQHQNDDFWEMNTGAGNKIRSYRDLIVWQQSVELVQAAYRISGDFPDRERFGLANQMRRAAVSISSNIAEGHGRAHLGEYLHHLSIAKGSLMELETQLVIAGRLGYVTSEQEQGALNLSGDVGRLLAGLVKALKGRRRPLTPST